MDVQQLAACTMYLLLQADGNMQTITAVYSNVLIMKLLQVHNVITQHLSLVMPLMDPTT